MLNPLGILKNLIPPTKKEQEKIYWTKSKHQQQKHNNILTNNNKKKHQEQNNKMEGGYQNCTWFMITLQQIIHENVLYNWLQKQIPVVSCFWMHCACTNVYMVPSDYKQRVSNSVFFSKSSSIAARLMCCLTILECTIDRIKIR